MNNIYESNYSNSEYYDRHPNSKNEPKQTTLEWHNWDKLTHFFKNYFLYFGDDISSIDKETFKRMIKTIWRFAYVAGVNEGMEEMRKNIPSFIEQLQDWFKDIQRYNEAEMEDTLPDLITPTDIWNEVLHLKIQK